MNVKICGITNFEDARLAADLGAWALGFIFYSKSPRYILPMEAGKLVAKLPSGIKTVGVFVNASAAEIATARAASGVTHVQLHGDETPQFCSSIPAPVIRALRPKTALDLATVPLYKGIDLFLVDAAIGGEYGGTGKLSNWDLARTLKQHGKVLLSGGLNPSNVGEAIRGVAPFAVDVSSGVEERPGKKSAEKLESLFRKVREAS